MIFTPHCDSERSGSITKMKVHSSYVTELRDTGTTSVPLGMVFSDNDLERIDAIQSLIPEENVSSGDSGDTHDLFVRRIMTDKADEFPTLVNRPFSDQIMEILTDEKRQSIFSKIFDSTSRYYIRRCQVNRMVKDSFIGLHLDAESNPDFEYSVIVQLSHAFEGGEFVVYPATGGEQVFIPRYGTVLITTCKFRHEVKKVLTPERRSLVYFYSTYSGPNRRGALASG